MRAVDENVGWLLDEQGFGLSSDERARIQTAAVILSLGTKEFVYRPPRSRRDASDGHDADEP